MVVCRVADDDFVISDEELDLEHMSSEAESIPPGGRRGKDVDSDFVLDEEESGSDWESSSRKPKPKVCVTHNISNLYKLRMAANHILKTLFD